MSTFSMPVRTGNSTRNIIEGTVLGLALTALSYIVGLHFGWLDAINWLEVFAVFTSYLCTYLCVMERRINYPIGAISTAAYCILFYQWGLLGSMVLNAYLTPSLLYGWLRWKRDDSTRPVKHVQVKWIPVYLIVTGLAYLGATQIMGAFGGVMVWTDALILAGTILAQFLLDNKKLENWLIWAVVNVFAIYTYASAGLALAAFQYVFFLLNTGYGYVMWRNSMKTQKVEAIAVTPATEPLAV